MKTLSNSIISSAGLLACLGFLSGCTVETNNDSMLPEMNTPSFDELGGWVPGGFQDEPWSIDGGDQSEQSGQDVALSPDGSLVVVGHFHGSLNLGGNTLTAQDNKADIFVAKFSSTGQHLWSKQFGDENGSSDYANQFGLRVAVDSSGAIYVAGNYQGRLSFSTKPGEALPTAMGTDIFVAKLTAAGDHVWSDALGGNDDQSVGGMALDGENVVVAGNAKTQVRCGRGGATTTAAGGKDVLAAVLVGGTSASCRLYGDSFDQSVDDVEVDPVTHDVALLGTFVGSINFGGGVLSSAGTDYRVFFARLTQHAFFPVDDGFDDRGSRVYPSYKTQPTGLARYGNGDFAATGYSWGYIDFGNDLIEHEFDNDIFVARLDSMGSGIWSDMYGGSGSQYGGDVVVDSNGNMVIAGDFKGSVNFGGLTLTAGAGATDAYIAKFDPHGSHMMSRDYGSLQEAQVIRGVAVDSLGNAFVTGAFAGTIDFGTGTHTSDISTDVFLARLSM